MLFDPEFTRAASQAHIARLIAEADAFRATRARREGRPRRSLWGWLRLRRRTAVPVPCPRSAEGGGPGRRSGGVQILVVCGSYDYHRVPRSTGEA